MPNCGFTRFSNPRAAPRAGGTYDAVAAKAFLAKRQAFNIGTTTLTFKGRDPAGNTHECVSRVVVQDVEPPVLKCPPNREVSVGLYPIVTSQYSSTFLYQVPYHIQ